ncbi:hypothetical protein DPMN_167851 [Dreissena polymorpha]|uniref:Uncharacterized protein n=1 Tax=Dreissena polymorpha TaxID=45954 RepID=A0A9D4IWQ1_DREPO|nr:hypothetical protein DPMN_167851 [Dreissena polymorpha]
MIPRVSTDIPRKVSIQTLNVYRLNKPSMFMNVRTYLEVSIQTLNVYRCEDIPRSEYINPMFMNVRTYLEVSIQTLNVYRCEDIPRMYRYEGTNLEVSIQTLNVYGCEDISRKVSKQTLNVYRCEDIPRKVSIQTLNVYKCVDILRKVSIQTLNVYRCEDIPRRDIPRMSIQTINVYGYEGTYLEVSIQTLNYLELNCPSSVPFLQGVKKLFHVGQEQKELVDPYFLMNFAGKERKKTSAADWTVLNFVTHRTMNGSNVSNLPDAWRSDTSAGDRIICD